MCIIATCLLLAGIIAISVGTALGARWRDIPTFGVVHFNNNVFSGSTAVLGTSDAADAALPAADITQLYVDAGAMSVRVVQGKAYGIAIGENVQFTSEVENNTWTIKARPERSSNATGEIVITLPEKQTLEKATFAIDAGKINVESLYTGQLYVDCGAGRVTLQDVTATEKSVFEVDAGDIGVKGILTGDVQVSCGMGRVGLTTPQPADYGEVINLGMGSVSIGGKRYSGMSYENKTNTNAVTVYTVECSMGEVSIKFA